MIVIAKVDLLSLTAMTVNEENFVKLKVLSFSLYKAYPKILILFATPGNFFLLQEGQQIELRINHD